MNETLRTMLMIPQAGVAMVEGTIVEWLVAEGDQVTELQPLYTLETEKVEMDVECPSTGVVHITGRPGETYQVGAVIGYIDGA